MPSIVSERTVQRLVNFGTVSLARVSGRPPNELLTLRCECGARGCSATVEATAAEHLLDGDGVFMVAPGHARGAGTIVSESERFARIAPDNALGKRHPPPSAASFCSTTNSFAMRYAVADARFNGWRDVWDFNDLDLSERRFRASLEDEETEAGRAALFTQLARIEGLRGDFVAGESLLAEAEALGGAESWVLIERGRLLRSSGDGPSALPLFAAAFEQACAADDGFLAGDAAHMAALVGDMEPWTARGIELTDDEPGRYWLAPLLNNLGWSRYEAGDFDRALDAFNEALAVRSEDPQEPHEREIARYAVGKTLRALGRIDDATGQLELAVGWATEAGIDTPYFHEELAECYAGAGRAEEARAQAERALELFSEHEAAGARLGRLLEPKA